MDPYEGQTLWCSNGDMVVVTRVTDGSIYVLYKGNEFERSKDIVGKKLFIERQSPVAVKSGKGNKVFVGNTVVIQDTSTESINVFKIIGVTAVNKPVAMNGPYYSASYATEYISEAEPENGIISILSPLGKALLGKKKNDVIKYDTPSGQKVIKVIDILR